MLDSPNNSIDFAQRPQLLQLLRRELVDFNANRFSNAGIVHEFVPAVLGARHTNVGNFAEAHMLARFRFKLAIELDRVFVDLAHRIGQVEQRQEASRMPC